MDNYLELLKLILPEFLVNHFHLINSTKNGEVMHLYFEERDAIPKEGSFLNVVGSNIKVGENVIFE